MLDYFALRVLRAAFGFAAAFVRVFVFFAAFFLRAVIGMRE
jgi:hypothetical protein